LLLLFCVPVLGRRLSATTLYGYKILDSMSERISEEIKVFLEKESTKSFLLVAQEFVDLLEDERISFQDFIIKAHSTLIALYKAGHNLEEISKIESNSDEEFKIDMNVILKNQSLISKLDKEALYWEVFDPTYPESENTPVQGWLVDDFSDIYRDLKRELEKIKLNTDEAVEDALWQLKFSFKNHWGNHCIDAMRALHYLYYEGKK
jgi:phosphopantetheine adenylyltransferase